MLFLGYSNCTTSKKAEKWLRDQGAEFAQRDIKAERPTYEELKDWHAKSGLPLRRFFNTSGTLYREMGLKDRLPGMDEEAQLRLLATDGMLVKRPLLIDGDRVLVGFRPKEWEAWWGAKR